MNVCTGSLLFVLLGFACVPFHAGPCRAMGFDATSVASCDDARSVRVNPAMLGVDVGFRGIYQHTYTDSSFDGDDAIFLATRWTGFGMEWYTGPDALVARRRTFASAFPLSESVHLGLAWSSGSSAFSSWDVGLLLRPSEHLSVGAVARALNRPKVRGERQARTVDLGVGLRPSGDRWTFLLGGTLTQDARLRDASFVYGMDAEPLDGVVLSVRADREGDIRAGVTLNLAHVGFGTMERFEKGHRGGIAHARFSRAHFRSVNKPKGRLVELKLSGALPDAPSGFSLFGGRAHTVRGIVSLFRRARNDRSVSGVILRLGRLDVGFGKLREIRDALIDFRSSGKRVVCYMETGGNREYVLASACDRIAFSPAGYLGLVGLRMEIPFVKGTLDKVGVRANLEKVGKYKSAADLLTREEMSNAHREMQNAILDDVYGRFIGTLAEGRGMDVAEVQRRIDEGPYTAREAFEAGLVDALVYPDEIEDLAKEMCPDGFLKVSAGSFSGGIPHRTAWGVPPRIAVIYASGAIVSGQSRTDFLTGIEMMGADTISRALRAAREEPSVRAIVLRIDSGGGSVLASDLIWREVHRTKGKKPLIVSMGDVAASGGYYIACMADTIIAEPGTITGSIGVFAGKYDLRRLYDRIGFRKEILTRGARAGIYTDYEELTEEQREIVRRQVREVYDDFVSKVAEGRGMSYASVDSIGRGRVWTGAQAREIGLVDALGGLDLAIELACARVGLSMERTEILSLPERYGVLRMLSYDAAGWIRGERLSAPFSGLEWAALFPEERILLLMPYRVEIR